MLADHLGSKQRPISASPPAGSSAPFPRLVFCISRSRGHADSILVDLLHDGVASSDIAVLFLDPDRSVDARKAGIPVPASSGAIRGVIASLAGARHIVMPGVGPAVVSGGLSESPGVEAPDGLPDVLQVFGVPQPEAIRLAGRIAEGHFFVAVRTSYSGVSDSARDIFLANKAEEICTKLDVLRPNPRAGSHGISPAKARP